MRVEHEGALEEAAGGLHVVARRHEARERAERVRAFGLQGKRAAQKVLCAIDVAKVRAQLRVVVERRGAGRVELPCAAEERLSLGQVGAGALRQQGAIVARDAGAGRQQPHRLVHRLPRPPGVAAHLQHAGPGAPRARVRGVERGGARKPGRRGRRVARRRPLCHAERMQGARIAGRDLQGALEELPRLGQRAAPREEHGSGAPQRLRVRAALVPQDLAVQRQRLVRPAVDLAQLVRPLQQARPVVSRRVRAAPHTAPPQAREARRRCGAHHRGGARATATA